MSALSLRSLVLNVVLLTGFVVGGWFVGTEVIAHKAAPATPVVVVSEVVGTTATAPSLVVPLGGLSPFGHHGGLNGRQILLGRVTSVDADGFVVATAVGDARFTFSESSFLLRLISAGPDAIGAGSAVALLVDGGTVTGDDVESPSAASVIVLPADSRPQITANIPVAPPPADDEEGSDDS